MFPGSNTLDPAHLDSSSALAKAIVNPEPPLNLPTGMAAKALGRSYENRRKVMAAQQLPSEAALATVMTAKMPSISGQAAAVQAMWQYMGGSGTPPGLTSDGLISPDAFVALQVASRYENPNWFNDLNERTPIGLQREQLLMEAIRLHVEYRSYELLQHVAVLLATMNGQQVRQEHGHELSELQQKIISTTGDVRAALKMRRLSMKPYHDPQATPADVQSGSAPEQSAELDNAWPRGRAGRGGPGPPASA